MKCAVLVSYCNIETGKVSHVFVYCTRDILCEKGGKCIKKNVLTHIGFAQTVQTHMGETFPS